MLVKYYNLDRLVRGAVFTLTPHENKNAFFALFGSMFREVLAIFGIFLASVVLG